METYSAEFVMYLQKLIKTIQTQASFSFGNVRLLDKTRIDDILCCIEANFPKEIVLYKKHYNSLDKNIKSLKKYNLLIANIKIKPLLGKSSYAINYNQVLEISQELLSDINSDVAYIIRTYPDLLK